MNQPENAPYTTAGAGAMVASAYWWGRSRRFEENKMSTKPKTLSVDDYVKYTRAAQILAVAVNDIASHHKEPDETNIMGEMFTLNGKTFCRLVAMPSGDGENVFVVFNIEEEDNWDSETNKTYMLARGWLDAHDIPHFAHCEGDEAEVAE